MLYKGFNIIESESDCPGLNVSVVTYTIVDSLGWEIAWARSLQLAKDFIDDREWDDWQ